MPYTPISRTRVNPGSQITTGLWNDLLDNTDFLNNAFTGPSGSGSAPFVLNGSFESPLISVSTSPNNWTLSNFTGGSSGTINTDQNHGAQCLRFVHPGGASNGGGTATSDFMTCSPSESYILEFMLKVSNATTHNKVVINWYDATQGALSSTTLYDVSSGNPTSWKSFRVFVNPVATAMFCKVVLTGGATDVNPGSSTNIMFDGISMMARPNFTYSNAYTSTTTVTCSSSSATNPPGLWRVKIYGAYFKGVGGNASNFVPGGYSQKVVSMKEGDTVAFSLSSLTGTTSSATITNSAGTTTLTVLCGQSGTAGTATGGDLNLQGGSMTANTTGFIEA